MSKKKHKKKTGKENHVKSSVIPSPDTQVEEMLPENDSKAEEPEEEVKARPGGSEEMPVWLL